MGRKTVVDVGKRYITTVLKYTVVALDKNRLNGDMEL